MEHRLFDPAAPPAWADPEWWRAHAHCDHIGSPTGAHVARLHAAAETVKRLAGPMPELGRQVVAVVDLGAGDGALLELLAERRPHAWGYEIILADVEHARNVRGVEVHHKNVRDELEKGRLVLGAPHNTIVVLTEVLEHMIDPHGFLDLLFAREEVRYVVASSPWGETPERHEPNHLWAWDEQGYLDMFEAAGFATRSFERVEWSQLWSFERPVQLTTEEARAALEDEQDAANGTFDGERGRAEV